LDLIESGLENPINHWYYSHKFWFITNSSFFKNANNNQLVDIGAGSALFSKELLRTNRVIKSVAVDSGYETDSEDEELNLSYRRKIDFAGYSHYLLTDVLEHIKDDKTFLSEVVQQAGVGAKFIITVPALMSLWSGHDLYLNHYRRYEKNDLRELVSYSGLTIQRILYTYSTIYLIAWLQRKIVSDKLVSSQMKDHGFVRSTILRILLLPDRWVSFLPFGVSLYVEATKND
jgi:hypothetical protein